LVFSIPSYALAKIPKEKPPKQTATHFHNPQGLLQGYIGRLFNLHLSLHFVVCSSKLFFTGKDALSDVE